MGRRFEEALQKALRMANESVNGLDPEIMQPSEEVGDVINDVIVMTLI